MKEKDPKHIERRKEIAKKKQKIREERFNDGQIKQEEEVATGAGVLQAKAKKYPASSHDVTAVAEDLDEARSKKTVVT